MEKFISDVLSYIKKCEGKNLVKQTQTNENKITEMLFNDNGKIFCEKEYYTDSEEVFWTYYDECGNMIYHKNSLGLRVFYSYNEYNDILRCVSNNGYQEYYDYDDNGELVHYKDTDDDEQWFYNGELIHRISSGRETIYNSNGKLIYARDISYECIYNGEEKLIYKREI